MIHIPNDSNKILIKPNIKILNNLKKTVDNLKINKTIDNFKRLNISDWPILLITIAVYRKLIYLI